MRSLVIFVYALYLFKTATAYCCFRDPWMLPTAPCTNSYTMATPCANANPCNIGTPCKCYRDPTNICEVCDPPSPMCQCLSKCGCDGLKYPLYFPEVEYPVTILDMDPYYYKTCFTY